MGFRAPLVSFPRRRPTRTYQLKCGGGGGGGATARIFIPKWQFLVREVEESVPRWRMETTQVEEERLTRPASNELGLSVGPRWTVGSKTTKKRISLKVRILGGQRKIGFIEGFVLGRAVF
jgi:hypothetical protein